MCDVHVVYFKTCLVHLFVANSGELNRDKRISSYNLTFASEIRTISQFLLFCMYAHLGKNRFIYCPEKFFKIKVLLSEV